MNSSNELLKKIKPLDIGLFSKRMAEIKTIGEFKKLGLYLKSKYPFLSDKEAIAILNSLKNKRRGYDKE